MQVADHAGCLQQSVSHFLIAAPSTFYRECNGVEVNETVTAGAGWNTDCFAHVANCCERAFEHTALLIAVEMVEQVGITDELGNETVGLGHGMRLPGRPAGVNRSPAALPWTAALGLYCDASPKGRNAG